MKLRCSRLPLFMKCAGSHEDAHPEDDERDEPTVPQAMGHASHEALAAYVLFDMWEPEWAEECAEKHMVDPGELGYLFRNGRLGWDAIAQHFGNPTVEKRESLNITEDIELTGQPDLASFKKAVGDWKSGHKEYDAEWQVQGGGRLCRAEWGFVIWLRGEAVDVYKLLPRLEFDRQIKAQCERYHAGERTVGDHCFSMYCPKADTCPDLIADFNGKTGKFLPAVAETHVLLAPEQVAQAYHMARMMEQGLKRFWPSLDLYLDRYGDLPIGNSTILTRREVITRKIDSSLALPIIEKFLPPKAVPEVFRVVIKNLEGQIGLTAEKGKKAARVQECMDELSEAGAIDMVRSRKRDTVRQESEADSE